MHSTAINITVTCYVNMHGSQKLFTMSQTNIRNCLCHYLSALSTTNVANSQYIIQKFCSLYTSFMPHVATLSIWAVQTNPSQLHMSPLFSLPTLS